MNPLFAVCSAGLIAMSFGAAYTPDVLPTPVLPTVVDATPVPIDGAAPPPAAPPTAEPEKKPEIVLDHEVFSRRALPVRIDAEDIKLEAPPPPSVTLVTMTRSAMDMRIREELIRPLSKRSIEAHRFSRVRLPKRTYSFEYETQKKVKAPKQEYIAFRLTSSSELGQLDRHRVIAKGRLHLVNKTIEVQYVDDKTKAWHPAAKAVKRLARLR